jgi:hypothetical protein
MSILPGDEKSPHLQPLCTSSIWEGAIEKKKAASRLLQSGSYHMTLDNTQTEPGVQPTYVASTFQTHCRPPMYRPSPYSMTLQNKVYRPPAATSYQPSTGRPSYIPTTSTSASIPHKPQAVYHPSKNKSLVVASCNGKASEEAQQSPDTKNGDPVSFIRSGNKLVRVGSRKYRSLLSYGS